MNEDDAFRTVLRVLVEQSIPHAIGGSVAYSHYGGIHSTRDVEIVIPVSRDRLNPVFDALDADFEIDRNMQPESATSGCRFPLRHRHSSFTVYLSIPAEDTFEHCRFKRRLSGTYLGQPTFFMSPEDVVLQEAVVVKKLVSRVWREELLAVVRGQWTNFDWAYVEYWADRQGTRALIDEVVGSMPRYGSPLDEKES